MTRLVVFGCSYTYGTGLPDCGSMTPSLENLIFNTLSPSKLGWASLLGQKLGIEVVNIGEPGGSNTEILYNILGFKYQPGDIVIVMWSNYRRDLIFTKNYISKHSDKWFAVWRSRFNKKLAAFSKVKENSLWIKYMNEHDYCVKTKMYMHHADLFFKNIGIKYLHYPSIPQELNDVKIDFLPIDNICNDGLFWIDKTPDGHPGIESNRLVADNIFKLLQNT
jgi:hypothetical protein